MSTRELLEIVKKRGMRITLEGDRPLLHKDGAKDALTDTLLNVLRFHRERIIEILRRDSNA